MKATIERIEKSDNPHTAPVITGYADQFDMTSMDEIDSAFSDYRAYMEDEGAEDWDLRMTVETTDKTKCFYSYPAKDVCDCPGCENKAITKSINYNNR